MAIYSIHGQPVAGGRDAAADSLRTTKQGFSYAAFVFGPFWLAAHRLWLALVIYVAASAVVGFLAASGILSPGAVSILEILAAVLIGFEGRHWLDFALARRGLPLVDIVEARGEDEAARVYFERVLAVAPPPGVRIASPRAATGVIGSFPEANGG